MSTANSALLIIIGLAVLYLAVTGGIERLGPGFQYILFGKAPSNGAQSSGVAPASLPSLRSLIPAIPAVVP